MKTLTLAAAVLAVTAGMAATDTAAAVAGIQICATHV